MSGEEADNLLMQIEEAFGLTKHDFGVDRKPFYTKWGDTNIEDLGEKSLKISKNLGDIYIDKIKTDKWVLIGKGTRLHCDDITAGEVIVHDFDGFLM